MFPVRLFTRFLFTLSFAAIGSAYAGSTYTLQSDVDYLGADRKEKVDIYLPSDKFERPVPAVLLIHGGGWRVGDKAAARERNIAGTLAENGYAVFSINYLLNVGERDPETKRLKLTRLAWPQNLYDCKSALRFIRANAKRFGVDSERIAVMGGSAGAHLSMMLGATVDNDEINSHGLYQDESNAVTCVLNMYGLHDVRSTNVTPFAGMPDEVRKANVDAASPVLYFDKNLPPMFITHGSADKTVPVTMSRNLVQELQKLGTPYVYIEIAGAPHTYDLQPKQFDLRPSVLSFLAQYLGKPELK